ncbi:SagB/ThcOx family dehydrogenase [Thiocystis violacea]|uniref:SagB/ThcOx family dehydrogenase n=1 Tax=Thiocystis violacea TaxID=13725 RepID=UPI0019078ED9|nr:SagB/ThcOx family dehydrogenase [Thiocystis violacea]MBK1723146.1 nitroreductase [Thiocystis violacea]
MTNEKLRQVYAYHFDSKHRPERYAPGPGGLDWATQPNPFRSFAGVPRLMLPLLADGGDLPFSAVRAGERPPAAPLDIDHLGLLLERSLGLSAWKSYGDARWALRCNPSSGNLHPTEAYLVSGGCPGLVGGVYHYQSHDHCLEQRAQDITLFAQAEAPGGVILALTSVHWREAWKYGLRAYRYCQHDVGHALAAVAYAAAVLGWRVERLGWSDATLARILGVDRAPDFDPDEREAPDLALWVGPERPSREVVEALRRRPWSFSGTANRLSPGHLSWHGIELVCQACERDAEQGVASVAETPLPSVIPRVCEQGAAALIRQRRSAVAFDGCTSMPFDAWVAMLDALLPRPGVPPLDAWGRSPRVNLLLFVHRVEAVPPGLYALVRAPDSLGSLRESLRPDWSWALVEGVPTHLGLYRLVEGDAREAARALACHQDIAGDGCFAVAMLAEFDAALEEGAWCYRELFWECGLLGQVLYLEAEAAGLRGTGIGCFFDDAVHHLLGIEDTRWQSLYHFTLGAPLEDARLQSEPPYAHREGGRLD